MGSRDTGALYTGVTSASVTAAERREKQLQAKGEVRSAMLPVAEKVRGAFEAERELLRNSLLDIVDEKSTDDQLAVKLNAIRLALKSLENVQTQINNILRLSKSERDAADKGNPFRGENG